MSYINIEVLDAPYRLVPPLEKFKNETLTGRESKKNSSVQTCIRY